MKPEITPLKLAEEISPEVLRDIYGRRRKSAYKDLSRTAQYHLEMALSLGREDQADSEWENHFDAANKVLRMMTTGKLPYSDGSLPFLYSEATILWSQLPAFKERCTYFPDISVDSMGLAHAGMVRVLANRVSRRRDGCLRLPLPMSRRAELELAGLLSREGRAPLFPYFSSAREERDNKSPAYNHDFYTITSSGKKVPIQVKTVVSDKTRQYDPGVLLIGRNEMKKAAPDVDVDRGGISTLLRLEDCGNISYSDRRRLSLLSSFIIDRVQEHIETNIQQS